MDECFGEEKMYKKLNFILPLLSEMFLLRSVPKKLNLPRRFADKFFILLIRIRAS